MIDPDDFEFSVLKVEQRDDHLLVRTPIMNSIGDHVSVSLTRQDGDLWWTDLGHASSEIFMQCHNSREYDLSDLLEKIYLTASYPVDVRGGSFVQRHGSNPPEGVQAVRLARVSAAVVDEARRRERG